MFDCTNKSKTALAITIHYLAIRTHLVTKPGLGCELNSQELKLFEDSPLAQCRWRLVCPGIHFTGLKSIAKV